MWHRVTWHRCCFKWMFGHCVFMERGMWWSVWLWYVNMLELWVWDIYTHTHTHTHTHHTIYIYRYRYISVPNCFSVNAEGANCNVVFILSRAVLNVTFMMCQTVLKWSVLLYSCEPSTNIVICTAICYEDCCMGYVLNIDTNLVRLPEVVNPILPSVRTLNIIYIAEIILFYTNHLATEGSVLIMYIFLYTFCTHFHNTFCTHFLNTFFTHFYTHSVHISITHSVHISIHILYTFP